MKPYEIAIFFSGMEYGKFRETYVRDVPREVYEKYKDSLSELKSIYEIMLETDGIYGGRFSGAGFKGCCMTLVDPEFKKEILKNVTEKYLAMFPQYKDKFSVHFCKSADGCRIK